jgi:hypothetical protein
MFCQSCGASVSGGFCANCGARASPPSAPSAPTPPHTPPPVITGERLSQLGGVAQEEGKEAAKLARQGIGAMAARMGKVPFCAAVLLWIAWFLLPAASLSGRAVLNQSYTFWGLIGTNFTSMLLMQRATSHGLFATIGLIASAAPFVAPFLHTVWARYLNAAPLAYALVAWIVIYFNEHSAFGTIAIEEGANPFSLSWGIFVLTFASIVLAAGALKKTKM